MSIRISSTPLDAFNRCARQWAFVHASGEDSGVGYAAGVGSVVHAILEHRITYGEVPTLEQVMAAGGNYDPPSVPLTKYAHKGIWDEAFETAAAVDDPWVVVPANFEDVVVEQPVGVWKLPVPGFDMQGYIDLFAYDPHNNTALVHDWKTRGKSSWRFRPHAEALASNRQLRYYAACARKATGADVVHISHGNLLRAGDGKPVFELVKSVLYGGDLDMFWEDLVEKTLPAMADVHRIWADVERRAQVPGDRSACFTYGPCAQMRRCNALDGASAVGGHTLDRLAAENAKDDLL